MLSQIDTLSGIGAILPAPFDAHRLQLFHHASMNDF
jgi:hypothetical protein